jgi:hypothetical protein
MGGSSFRHAAAVAGLILMGIVPASSQTGTPATQPPAPSAPATPPPAPPATAFSYKGFNFTGWVDAYYSKMFNAPNQEVTQLQAFNLTANKMSLNSATGSFSYDPAPVGFKFDIGYGRTYDSFMISEPKKTDWARYVINAYASFKPAAWKGLQIDFGKFVTSAGAEVTESHLNWNYSRSLLFAYGPYYHFGVRAAAPVTSSWTLGGSLTQGWNVISDNNSGKTVGITSVNTLGKVSIANNYYTGPENNNTTKGWRNFYDLVTTVNWNDRVSTYVNFDVGSNKSPDGVNSTFLGIGSSTRIALTKHFAISPRIEWYNDADGFMTGTAQQIKEFTITGEAKLNESFLTRLEYRKDWSDSPYFVRDATSGNLYKDQQLFLVSFIMVVKPGMFNFGNGKTK